MRVMTWNVENLFGVGGPAGVTTQPEYDQKLANIASKIAEHNPDVVALQEVGDPHALDDLMAQPALAAFAHKTVSDFPDPAPGHAIRVAFVSKLEPVAVSQLSEFPAKAITSVEQETGTLQRLGRGALCISVQIGGENVRVVTLHLKSKILTYPGGRTSPHDEDERARVGGYALFRRAAEAVAVRVWANQMLTDNQDPLIVMGDLNDGPDAATTQILYGPPDMELRREDKGDAWRLVNLARFLPPGDQFSRKYHNEAELIDHILTTPALARRNVSIVSDTQHVTSVSDQPTDRTKAVWPDHAPLVATIV